MSSSSSRSPVVATQDPAGLDAAPYEQTNIWEIAAKGEIRVFNKIMMVFAALCKEIVRLKAEAEDHFMAPFIAYGQFDTADEGAVQQQMGRMLSVLRDMEAYAARCHTVLHNVVLQLGQCVRVRCACMSALILFLFQHRFTRPTMRCSAPRFATCTCRRCLSTWRGCW